MLDDPGFCKLFLRVICFKGLTARQTKYLIWKFYFNMSDIEIAKYDGLKVGRAAISLVICNAFRTIRKYYSSCQTITYLNPYQQPKESFYYLPNKSCRKQAIAPQEHQYTTEESNWIPPR